MIKVRFGFEYLTDFISTVLAFNKKYWLYITKWSSAINGCYWKQFKQHEIFNVFFLANRIIKKNDHRYLYDLSTWFDSHPKWQPVTFKKDNKIVTKGLKEGWGFIEGKRLNFLAPSVKTPFSFASSNICVMKLVIYTKLLSYSKPFVNFSLFIFNDNKKK